MLKVDRGKWFQLIDVRNNVCTNVPSYLNREKKYTIIMRILSAATAHTNTQANLWLRMGVLHLQLACLRH